MKSFLLLTCVLAAGVASAEKQPYERYQSIVDRQMFGPLPPGFDPTKAPSEVQRTSVVEKELTKEQEKLQSSIHFSVINVTPDGTTAVGFTDNSDPKTPTHYYLKVGERRNGWEVKAADAAAATMTIVKDDIEVSLSLGGNSAKGGGTTARAGASAASAGAGSDAAGASASASGVRRGLLGGSLRSLRRMRRQEDQAVQAAQAKAAEVAAAREAERQAQAEQDRAQREAERAEQRQQLLAIQEELKKVRAEKEAKKAEEEKGGAENDVQ